MVHQLLALPIADWLYEKIKTRKEYNTLIQNIYKYIDSIHEYNAYIQYIYTIHRYNT